MQKLNLSCPVNQTGYGIASFNLLKNLNNQFDITYFPIGQPLIDNQLDYELLTSLLSNRLKIDIYAPYIKIWHQFDLLEHIGRGSYYAYPFFELDTFNYNEKINMSVPDHLFVTSNWAKEILINNQISKPITVVPLGVDRNIFSDSLNSNVSRTNDNYIFLNIGKWEIRKGHDILYKLFNDAFPTEEDVELWVVASEKTNNYSDANELIKWKNTYSSSRIKIYSGFNTQKEIANVISQSDCGIYPSRAEGWNMELLETMSMNKPVIATNFSAHTEFCNPDNCFLVDIDSVEKANDGKAFHGQGNWAKLGQNQYDQIIEHMRYCYKNKIRSNNNGVKTAKLYSWANSSNIISRCIYN